jgi:hypothetical protein
MKKQFIILFLIIASLSSRSQNSIQTTTPCNDALLQKTPGRWIKQNDLLYATGISKQQQAEVLKRLDAIHQLVLSTYPELTGIDAAWHRGTGGNGLFGASIKYRTYSGGITFDLEKGTPIANYNYTAGFFRYYCNPNTKNEMWQGYPGETGTFIHIYANTLNRFSSTNISDTMTVDGRPVRLKLAVKARINDNEIVYDPEGGNICNMLIHRSGELPYMPVTRKQYLKYCLSFIQIYFDEQTVLYKQSQPDKEQLKSQLEQLEKDRARFLKRYQDEIKKTTDDGLLESPAMVYQIYPMLFFNDKVFLSEKEGGRMLITENPEYIKKELPIYMPQLFVVEWTWDDWAPQANIRTIMETKFPFEKLQAMIDK